MDNTSQSVNTNTTEQTTPTPLTFRAWLEEKGLAADRKTYAKWSGAIIENADHDYLMGSIPESKRELMARAALEQLSPEALKDLQTKIGRKAVYIRDLLPNIIDEELDQLDFSFRSVRIYGRSIEDALSAIEMVGEHLAEAEQDAMGDALIAPLDDRENWLTKAHLWPELRKISEMRCKIESLSTEMRELHEDLQSVGEAMETETPYVPEQTFPTSQPFRDGRRTP